MNCTTLRISGKLIKYIFKQTVEIRGHAISRESVRRWGCREFQTQTNSTFFEITQGAGGSESQIFAKDMLHVYLNYFQHMRWTTNITDNDDSSKSSGTRTAKILVTGNGAFEGLVQEAGVHRVQRVPKTEKSGRMHTSTIAIFVVPKSVLDVKLNDRDLEFTTKNASGAGGQFVNKTESAIRLRHIPTNILVESQESRHQIENRKTAMQKLLKRLQDMELEKMMNRVNSMRKSQVVNADRSEKIRTYNFPQDRITDHRLGKNYHNLNALFSGDVTILEKMIRDYQSH